MSYTVWLPLIVFAICFPLYHSVYLYLTRKKPQMTKKGRINSCISSWLGGAFEKGQFLLVVHQIRNMIMSITFLASTSILLVGFLLTYELTDVATGNGLTASGTIDYPG